MKNIFYSPFRYAGGKTWLIPYIRLWLSKKGSNNIELMEIFAGSGIVSLTAVFENLVKKVTMVEIDQDVAAVWKVLIYGKAKCLANKIKSFNLTLETANKVISIADKSDYQRAFATIIRNRINVNGVLADNAGVMRNIKARWYPETLSKRILAIHKERKKICFLEQDGLQVCQANTKRDNVIFFIDPPYTKAGKKLYRHFKIDNDLLFKQVSGLTGDFLMTYDDVPEICGLVEKYGFKIKKVIMKTAHHIRKKELLISKNFDWLN